MLIQELNTDFAKICITPRPSGPPVARVPLPVLKELELQARQNISTLNFTAAFAKTSSSCNASLEKCQHSIKSTVKKIKSQIQKGANPEKAAKRGYEEVADYLDFWNKTVLVQHRALTCLSKSLAHILQRELYSMANTGLLRREAEMTLLHPQLGETRRQELRNSSFWGPSLFESQLVKEGEDFLLKKGTSKDSQGFTPYQNKPFRGPHKKRGSYRKRPNDSSKASLSPPVGGCLRSFRRDWLTNKCSQNVLNIITNGYVLPFRSKPNLIRFPLILSEYKAQQKDQALATCIQSLLSKNAIERVDNVKFLGFYSRLFLVPKPHQRWRPVIDLSRLNTFLHVEKFKMETPESIRTSLIPGEWVASIDLSDAYLHIPIHPSSRKYLRFCYKAQVFQFTSLPFGLATAPQVFTMIVKEVKLMALSRGLRIHQYLDDWLIRSQSQEEAQVNTQAVVELTQSLGWIINQEKSELKPTQVFSFVGYEYHLDSALVKPTQERWLKLQDLILQLKSKRVLTARCLMSLIGLLASTEKMVPEGRLHMRPFQFHLKEHWRYPGQPPSLDRSHCSPPRLVAKSLQCDDRCRPSSQRPQYPTLYRRLKRRLGRSLRPKFYQGSVVRSGKKASHKCPRIEGGLPGPSRLQGPVPESNSVGCDGQLNSGSLHQQTRGNTLGRDVCSPVEDHDLVPSLSHNIESQAHSRVPECDGRPAIQVQPSAVNRMVSAPTGLQTDLPEVVHTSCRLICHSPEPQTPSIRVSYPRPKGLGHRCSEHKLDQPHSICVPSYGSPSQGDPKDQAMPVPDHRNSPRLARDALVLGPSAALNRDPTATPSVNNPTQTVPQAGVPQQPPAHEPPRLVSRSGQLQEQGFSVEVAERIAAPQRSSTRTIYKSKWALFEKWCRENSVDFSTPSVKQISDFFMYLYQDLNRRPSTIDGYRTAIVDTLGPTAQHIAHNADLHRLLSSFHRDRPKSSRNLPKWNLSVVLNELTKAPFEPMKDTDLKHLTLKTAFLLALASGKRRSEIHAWVANKVSNLGQWEKVALFPSSDFIAKNQLAREGSQSVSPVTIPALTTIVDRQFKEDRTLCPVRALRFYLDRTKDLRGSRSLLFISFKKGHTSDIRPATLSSWLKQTILLCYKQADQQALDLVQVKAHDIRAFAASKAFYGGVSVDQIMQACHWKAHNTFTNFYLKDLTWSDTDNNLYLGPVVAAQQVLDPSPQTSCPRKEKKGGGGGGGAHPLQPSLQESFPGSRYSFTFKMLRVRSFYPLIIK